jgi:predicted PolB exonuclease-like 3'-5' exonuclease
MYLVLDLETVPDPTLPTPKDPNLCPKCKKPLSQCLTMTGRHSAPGDDLSVGRLSEFCGYVPPPPFPAAPYHQVVAIGYAHVTTELQILDLGVIMGHEALILQDLFTYMNSVRDTLVGFNSRHFDAPVLAARSMRHGLAWPWYYQKRGARHRYSHEDHFDVLDFLSDYGASKRASLNVWARLVGMPGKGDVGGGDVAGMIERGEVEKVKRYNAGDVINLWGVALRVLLLKGAISLEQYRFGAREACREILENPLLEDLVGKVEGRFLLEETPS